MKIFVIFVSFALACVASGQEKCDDDVCSHHCVSALGWEGGFCDENDCMCFNSDGHVNTALLIKPLKSPLTDPKVEPPKDETKLPVAEPKVEPKPPVTEPEGELSNEETKPPGIEPPVQPTREEVKAPVSEPKVEHPEQPKRPVIESQKEPPTEQAKLPTKPQLELPKEESKSPVTEPKVQPTREETRSPVSDTKVGLPKENPKPAVSEPKVPPPIKETKPPVPDPKLQHPTKSKLGECRDTFCLSECNREDWMWGLCLQGTCWCYEKMSNPGKYANTWNIRKLLDDILKEKNGFSPKEPESVLRAEVQVTKPTKKEPGKQKPLPMGAKPPCDESDCLAECEKEDWLWGCCDVDFCWCWEKTYRYNRGKKTPLGYFRKLLLDILDEK